MRILPGCMAFCFLCCGCTGFLTKKTPVVAPEKPPLLLSPEVQGNVAFSPEHAEIALFDPSKPVLEPPQSAPVISLAEKPLDGKEGELSEGRPEKSQLVEVAEGNLLDTRVRRRLARAEEEGIEQRRKLLELERRLEATDIELEKERTARLDILNAARKLQAEREKLLAENERLSASAKAPTPRAAKPAVESQPVAPVPSENNTAEKQTPARKKLEKSWLFRVTARPGEDFVLCRLPLQAPLNVFFGLEWLDAAGGVVRSEQGETRLAAGTTTIRGRAPAGAGYARLRLREK